MSASLHPQGIHWIPQRCLNCFQTYGAHGNDSTQHRCREKYSGTDGFDQIICTIKLNPGSLYYHTAYSMAFNEKLAERVRQQFASLRKVEEKKMMGGLTFMVNGKMCVGVLNDDLMLRIAPDEYEQALERRGCREMDFTGKPMKGFVFVSPEGTRSQEQLTYWTSLALAFNKKAKAARKK